METIVNHTINTMEENIQFILLIGSGIYFYGILLKSWNCFQEKDFQDLNFVNYFMMFYEELI